MKFVKRLLEHFPRVYYFVFWIRYKLEILRANRLVIITTPGHVGSSTVFNSLKTVPWPGRTRVYDIHSLRERFNNDSPVHSVSARHVLQEVLRGMVSRKSLGNKDVTVISIVRDPVARALGGMFQNSGTFIKGVGVDQVGHEDFEESLEQINRQLVNDGLLATTVAWQLSFYKTELSEYWRFRMEDLVMNESVGTLNSGSHTLIMLILEDLSDNFSDVMHAQFGTRPRVVIANNNTSDFYEYCKRNLKIDGSTLQPIYADSFLEKVYGNERLESMMQKWSKR